MITTDIPNLEDEKLLRVYPNPVTDLLKINVEDKSTIQLLRYDGGIVYESSDVFSELLDINSLNISDGLYLVHIFNEKYTLVKKVLVQKH